MNKFLFQQHGEYIRQHGLDEFIHNCVPLRYKAREGNRFWARQIMELLNISDAKRNEWTDDNIYDILELTRMTSQLHQKPKDEYPTWDKH